MDNQMVYAIAQSLRDHTQVSYTPAGQMEYRAAKYIAPEKYEFLSDYAPLTGSTVIPSDTVFIKGTLSAPDEILSGPDYRDYLRIDIPHREGIVIINGEPYHGLDDNRSRIPLREEWAGKTLDFEVIVFGTRDRHRNRTFVNGIGFERIDLKIESCYYLYIIANDFMRTCGSEPDNMHIRVRVNAAIENAVKDLDLDLEGEALRASVALAEKRLLDGLAEIDDGDVRGLISLIGHTHIDVAWLWQLKDTVRKCGHSFTNMLRLMDEFPDFTFSCSQLQLMDYTKRYYPAVFEQIKERVRDGRWECVGPMWVESDCNVVSGESLVRQLIYGINFAEKEFGTHSHVAWLPDTFGFQPNMPQILKKSGTDYFYTYKLHWQHQNRFPYGMFRWEGLDGSEIISSVAYNPGCYNGNPTPDQLREAKNRNLQNGEFDNVIFPYGHGDGGGGPTREMIEYAHRLKDFPGLPRTRMERADEYFARLETQRDKLPKWYGELYIETHRGTLTTQGKIKRNNRTAEIGYQNAEKLGVLASLMGADPDWKLLSEGWKKILLLQFHDILPGSSINPVYSEDCKEGYEFIFSNLEKFTNGLKPASGESFAVYNFLSWNRDALVSVETDASAACGKTVVGADGKAVPTSVECLGNGKARVTFKAALPALGFAKFSLASEAAVSGKASKVSTAGDGSVTVETDGFVVTVDALGRLSSVYDKAQKRDAVSAPANDIRLFRDGPQSEDAWNIYDIYKERPVSCDWSVELSVKENSPLRTVVHVSKKIEKCAIEQDICIYPDSPIIDFRTHIDWTERHKVMRVYFPANVKSQFAAYEVGFGTFLRPAKQNTSFDKSRFEVNAHKFADLSEGDYGVSLLNDCKYAHSCDDNVIGLTLLRGTTHPDPLADLGGHEINYAFYPHAGDWRTAGTPRRGHEFNNNPVVWSVADDFGADMAGKSLAVCSSENIIIDTVKPAEDGNGIIIRAYECNGCRGNADISLAFAPEKVSSVDLVEGSAQPANVNGSSISFAYGPYEIITFRVEK
ncbi:MAG: glycoside hydrolase family 38 C-terminal domain-containing protein [Clostridiales bacterium]|nr:glycoside hydrolase family 38 C-terminal domain-containing protein [Clostridiales bacterium]